MVVRWVTQHRRGWPVPPALWGRRSPGGQTLMWLGDGLARHGSPWEGTSAEAGGLGREPPRSSQKLQPQTRWPGSGRMWEGHPVLALLRRGASPPALLQDKGRGVRQ